MSGLILLFSRDGSPVDRSLAGRLLACLDHRGCDGSRLVADGAVALGHQHFWTTPEEVGERQPLAASGGDCYLLFDGRIDNRKDLLHELGLDHDLGRQLSDAQVLLRAYLGWAEDCFARLIGPYAVALYDRKRARVVCTRDPLGARTLFYYLRPGLLVVASEEATILGHPQVSDRLDEDSVARHFAILPPRNGATFFSDIEELEPGGLLIVEREGVERRSASELGARRSIRYRRETEYAEHFLEVLRESVRCRLRAPEAPAVLLSGGLDSGSLAALAAQSLSPRRVMAISWIFDELEECDERQFAQEIVSAHDLAWCPIPGDDAWPLRSGWGDWPAGPSRPFSNPYRLLLDRAYEAASEAGRRVLLTGWFGDELYSGGEAWWLDLLAERRICRATMELLRGMKNPPGLRRLAAVAIRSVGAWSRGTRPKHDSPGERHRAWLTPTASSMLTSATRCSVAARDGFGLRTALEEHAPASRRGMELRHPYRDRRLVELALALPAHQLFRPGREKHILRNAMRGILPETARKRQGHAYLSDLFDRGVRQQELETVRVLLDHPQASWDRSVRASWLRSTLRDCRPKARLEGVEAVVAWQCISWEIWRRRTSSSIQPPALRKMA